MKPWDEVKAGLNRVPTDWVEQVGCAKCGEDKTKVKGKLWTKESVDFNISNKQDVIENLKGKSYCLEHSMEVFGNE